MPRRIGAGSGACTVRRSPSRVDAGAQAGQDLGELRAELRGVGRPAGDRDGAAGDHRRGEERRGVGEVGLDRDVLRADRPGRDHPPPGSGLRHLDAAARERLDRHVDVRHARQPLAGVAQVQAASNRGAASSRPETNWLEALASISTSPPRTRPCRAR